VIGCLSLAANDPRYSRALAHPKSTPAVNPRVLQRVAALFKQQAADLEANWSELPEHEHEWWISWATDTLPRRGLFEIGVGLVLVGITLTNMILFRDDALEVLTSGRALRNTVIKLRSSEVWSSALADPDFVAASQEGFEDLAAGRVSVVALKDL
jgi:hypothetical protein